jgi:FdhD protein
MSPTRLYSIRQFQKGIFHEVNDELIVEEPLEIRLDNRHYKTVMRTPGPTPNEDLLLAQGLLFSDGIVAALEEFERLEHSTHHRDFGDQLVNVVNATLHDDSKLPEEFPTRSMPLEKVKLHLDTIRQWPDKVRPHQKLSLQTGGCHAAAILDGSSEVLCCFEDIGRHNAVDKAVGHGLENSGDGAVNFAGFGTSGC